MDGIVERTTGEIISQRRGLAPFNHDVDLSAQRILSEPIPSGSLGVVNLILESGTPTDDEGARNISAFLLNESGEITRGSLSDFEGKYFNVTPTVHIEDISQAASLPGLQTDIWIDGTSSTSSIALASKPLGGYRVSLGGDWTYRSPEVKEEYRGMMFVPKDNGFMKRLRLSFSKPIQGGEVR